MTSYEDDYLLGCSGVQSRRNWPTIQRCLLPTSSERWLKRRSTSTRLHGATSQKTVIFILAAVITCCLTDWLWAASTVFVFFWHTKGFRLHHYIQTGLVENPMSNGGHFASVNTAGTWFRPVGYVHLQPRIIMRVALPPRSPCTFMA
jgi:hypothetical protein